MHISEHDTFLTLFVFFVYYTLYLLHPHIAVILYFSPSAFLHTIVSAAVFKSI